MLIFWPATFATLWLITLLAAEESWQFMALFYLALILPIGAWGLFADAKKARARLRDLTATLKDGQVREVRIVTTALVDFQEEEDEGAQYAFDLGDGTLVFVAGQDFYATRSFPNSDFSLLYVHAPDGKLVDLHVATHGKPLAPIRTISAEAKRRLRIPNHLERFEGSLAEIEHVLAA